MDNLGNEIIKPIKLKIDDTVGYKQEDTIIEGESILACVENNNLTSGNYIFRVTGSTDGGATQETIEYPVELYNYNKDANYITNNINTIKGIAHTGFGNAGTEKRMLILKYNGSLKINKGVNILPIGRNKKGMLIYCAGEFINNGTITMSAKGTYNQAGENVYLYKNENNSYEYVPATGGIGGVAVSGDSAGKAGTAGTLRRTGGGGSGGSHTPGRPVMRGGSGGNGTSYSGGTGGGAGEYPHNGAAGSSIGGNGGGGYASGAGNAGGLLIIDAKAFTNKGTIASNGTGTSYVFWATGGGSAGGSINIFYKESIQRGSITANGGTSGTTFYGPRRGGNGGAGCITCGSIASGTFVKD